MIELEIIKALAEEGNMRKAADRLFLSQPALSQRLQSIEKEWETQLFIRSQKGLELTLEFSPALLSSKYPQQSLWLSASLHLRLALG